jgi:hypothetical protein
LFVQFFTRYFDAMGHASFISVDFRTVDVSNGRQRQASFVRALVHAVSNKLSSARSLFYLLEVLRICTPTPAVNTAALRDLRTLMVFLNFIFLVMFCVRIFA